LHPKSWTPQPPQRSPKKIPGYATGPAPQHRGTLLRSVAGNCFLVCETSQRKMLSLDTISKAVGVKMIPWGKA
ncbi:unnamed protein product, partial [Ixodes pacificus]